MSAGPWQIIIVLLIVLLIFGPKKIPAIGKSLGEAFRGFKKGVSGDERDVTPENEKLEANNAQPSTTVDSKEKDKA